MKPIKIVIADDHWMVRDGIKQLLELDGQYQVVAQVENGRECLETLEQVESEVLLLDINMPNGSGLEILQEIKAKNENLKIIMLTIHNEVQYVNKAISLGADGYVLKDASSDELKRAIKVVINNDQFIDPVILPYLYSERTNVYEEKKKKVLTDREQEVLVLLTQGMYNKEIAFELGISEKTVKNHVSNIFKKIGVFDRTQAAIYAIKNNIVELV